jgi:hypothetical protein
MTQLLTAIALWCGQPIGFTTYAQVEKCRREMLSCTTENIWSPLSYVRRLRTEHEINVCFQKQEQP